MQCIHDLSCVKARKRWFTLNMKHFAQMKMLFAKAIMMINIILCLYTVVEIGNRILMDSYYY